MAPEATLQPGPIPLSSGVGRAESTPFENGVFKIKLVLPSEYPQAPPKGTRLPAPCARLVCIALVVVSHHIEPARLGGPSAGYFLTKIFHPNISKTGEICVNTLKKDWRADLGIGHVLQVLCGCALPRPPQDHRVTCARRTPRRWCAAC